MNRIGNDNRLDDLPNLIATVDVKGKDNKRRRWKAESHNL